jgi:hypothetical protein
MWTRIRCAQCRTDFSSVRALLAHTHAVARDRAPERDTGAGIEPPDAPHKATPTDATSADIGNPNVLRTPLAGPGLRVDLPPIRCGEAATPSASLGDRITERRPLELPPAGTACRHQRVYALVTGSVVLSRRDPPRTVTRRAGNHDRGFPCERRQHVAAGGRPPSPPFIAIHLVPGLRPAACSHPARVTKGAAWTVDLPIVGNHAGTILTDYVRRTTRPFAAWLRCQINGDSREARMTASVRDLGPPMRRVSA